MIGYDKDPKKNPKWSKYKHSCTMSEVFKNGASGSDVAYDLDRGIMTIHDPVPLQVLACGDCGAMTAEVAGKAGLEI